MGLSSENKEELLPLKTGIIIALSYFQPYFYMHVFLSLASFFEEIKLTGS